MYYDKRHQKKAVVVLGLLAALLVSGPVLGATKADMEKVLSRLDEMSNFGDEDFSSVMTVVSEDPEKGLDKITVRMFRRDRDDKFLLLFQEPAVQRGQGYLMDGDNLWFYDPESRKFSHTSLKDSFGGTDARNSDFRRQTIAEDYEITSYSEGKLGRFEVYVIELKARNDEVTYPYLKIWVTKDPNLVLKSEEYSLTKRLMRTSLYPSYAKVGNSYIAKHMIFVDELVKGKKTQVTISEVSQAPLPDSVFTKSYVERVNR